MRGMQYLISFALLVALAAWMVGVYNNLDHLRCAVCRGWSHWREATHRRNVCLNDFAHGIAGEMPEVDSLSRVLLRLAADSERTLSLAVSPRWGDRSGFLGGAEQQLRLSVNQAVRMIEGNPDGEEDAHLQQLCSNLSVTLYQQDQMADLYNRAAREYNDALHAPSARFLAPVFGFLKVNSLEPCSMQSARST